MKTGNIENMKGGWFIGDFEPTLFKTKHFEIAHHKRLNGWTASPHIHKKSREYNYIVRGRVIVGNLCTTDKAVVLGPGDYFIYEPNNVADVHCLEDTDLIVIKIPSLPDDKYPVNVDITSPHWEPCDE